MGKVSVSEIKKKPRHNPLDRDIYSSGGTFKGTRKDSQTSKSHSTEDEYLDAATSRKILHLATEQQNELEAEESRETMAFVPLVSEKYQLSVESDEEDDHSYSDFDGKLDGIEEEELELEEQDLKIFEKYFCTDKTEEKFNLGDKILSLIQEKEEMKSRDLKINSNINAVRLPPKVIAAYQKIGRILSSYTHGKLPKLFKILPTLKNWEDVLYVTDPERWTPHATYEATKLFVSNLRTREAQRFVESVLLEKFRTSIEDSENHTLDYHTYRAIRKSLYKPGAFFKGFLLPLVDSHCTVREATVAASALAKASVPVLHSSVALSQLVQRDYNPAATVFIRVLIEKRYALPYQTLDEIVFYFMRFRQAAQDELGDTEELPLLPVVWHKAFLAFAQRYKNDITDDQRDFLLETLRQRFHHAIGPEIRRELLSGSSRME